MKPAPGILERPLRFRYRRSRHVMALVAVAHAGAVPAVVFSGMPRGWMAAAIAVIAASFIREFLSFRSARAAACSFVLDGADRWWVEDPDGLRALRVVGVPFVHPLLVVIRLRDDARRSMTLVLAADNCEADMLRRLRVRLRYPVSDGHHKKGVGVIYFGARAPK